MWESCENRGPRGRQQTGWSRSRTTTDDNGCTMAKGGNGEEMRGGSCSLTSLSVDGGVGIVARTPRAPCVWIFPRRERGHKYARGPCSFQHVRRSILIDMASRAILWTIMVQTCASV